MRKPGEPQKPFAHRDVLAIAKEFPPGIHTRTLEYKLEVRHLLDLMRERFGSEDMRKLLLTLLFGKYISMLKNGEVDEVICIMQDYVAEHREDVGMKAIGL